MPIPQIPLQEMPKWLRDFTPTQHVFPINELLSESVYYPACEFDGRVIHFLVGNFHSFVYVDYGVDSTEARNRVDGFRGYERIFFRAVTAGELRPTGWTPQPLLPIDGNPQSFQDYRKPPFAYWAILQRQEGLDDKHGPKHFSLLYVGGDGAATFDALYWNKASPALIAVFQHGFGCNWTQFEDSQQILGRLVLGNPAGRPTYLLHGGGGLRGVPCWPDYSDRIWHFDKAGLAIWRLPGAKLGDGGGVETIARHSSEEKNVSAFAEAMFDQLRQPDREIRFHLRNVDHPHGRDCPCREFIYLRSEEQHLIHTCLGGRQKPRVLDVGCGIGRHRAFARLLAPMRSSRW